MIRKTIDILTYVVGSILAILAGGLLLHSPSGNTYPALVGGIASLAIFCYYATRSTAQMLSDVKVRKKEYAKTLGGYVIVLFCLAFVTYLSFANGANDVIFTIIYVLTGFTLILFLRAWLVYNEIKKSVKQ